VDNPGIFMLIFGLILAVIGGLILRQQTRLRRKGVRVMGTVTRIEKSVTTSTSYTPVVRFPTQAGEEVETVTKVGMPWAGPPVGQVVPVIYDPADPTLAEIDTWGRRGLLTVLGLMLPGGVALMVVGTSLLIQG
jgi:hypothetical protein